MVPDGRDSITDVGWGGFFLCPRKINCNSGLPLEEEVKVKVEEVKVTRMAEGVQLSPLGPD